MRHIGPTPPELSKTAKDNFSESRRKKFEFKRKQASAANKQEMQQVKKEQMVDKLMMKECLVEGEGQHMVK